MAHWVNSNKKADLPAGFVNRMATLADDPDPSENGTVSRTRRARAPTVAPTAGQRAYLSRGLAEPGGKLPLFDRGGRAIPRKTVESCLARGWSEPWFDNPLKPDWLVCRLTASGYAVLGASPPGRDGERR
jgi:hypothetical protein